MLDEFRAFIIKYLQKEDISTEELIELLKFYDRCTNEDNLLNPCYLSLLDTENEKLLDAVIHSIVVHKVTNQDIVAKIINILEKSTSKNTIIACLQYFGSYYI